MESRFLCMSLACLMHELRHLLHVFRLFSLSNEESVCVCINHEISLQKTGLKQVKECFNLSFFAYMCTVCCLNETCMCCIYSGCMREACVHMVCVLVFVQCGRGWSGRSIGNKWIQINIKPGSEGERRRDWKRVSGVMHQREGGGGGGGGLEGWCVTSSTATNCTLGKDHSFLQPKPQRFEVTDG